MENTVKEPFRLNESASVTPPKQSLAWRLWHEIRKGYRMSREDKNWLAEVLYTSEFGMQGGIIVDGWYFDFSGVLHTYWVKARATIEEYRAPDLKSLKNLLSLAEIVPQQIVKVGVNPLI